MEFKGWRIITSVKRLKTIRIHLILLTHFFLREVSVCRLFEDRFAKKQFWQDCLNDSKKAYVSLDFRLFLYLARVLLLVLPFHIQ